MELRHLRYFIAVAENLSITQAARQLMIAQPPLSRQIRDLEKELGAALFERTPHGLRLTPEGNAFLPYARRVTDLAKESRELISEMSRGLQGSLYIASVEGRAPRLLARWIADFRTKHPDVSYNIWNGSTDDVLYRVTNGLAEIGITTEPHNAEGLLALPVCTEPWTVLLPADDPLAQREGHALPISALADRDLIIPSRESRLREIQNWFPDKETPLRIRCRVAHMLNAYELVRQKVGIAIYPASDDQFLDDPAVVIKTIVDPAVAASYILVWDRARRLSPAAAHFIESVCASLGQPMPE